MAEPARQVVFSSGGPAGGGGGGGAAAGGEGARSVLGWQRLSGLRAHESAKRRTLNSFRKFEASRRRGWLLPISYLLDLMEDLAKYGDYKRLGYVISSTEEKQMSIPNIAYLRWMQALDKGGETERCPAVLYRMDEVGVPASGQTFNFLLAALGRIGKVRQMHKCWLEMRARGIEPTAETYSALISHSGEHGSFYDARQYWADMVYRRIKPTTTTYNALLGAYNATKDYKGAQLLYEYMRDSQRRMDVRTFTEAIYAYGRLGLVEKAIEAYKTIQTRRIKMNLQVYTAFMDAMARNGYVNAAEVAFETAKDYDVDRPMFHVLLRAYAQEAKVQEFENCFDEMIRFRILPGAVTLKLVERLMVELSQRGCTDEELFERVRHMRREMHQKNRMRERQAELRFLPAPKHVVRPLRKIRTDMKDFTWIDDEGGEPEDREERADRDFSHEGVGPDPFGDSAEPFARSGRGHNESTPNRAQGSEREPRHMDASLRGSEQWQALQDSWRRGQGTTDPIFRHESLRPSTALSRQKSGVQAKE